MNSRDDLQARPNQDPNRPNVIPALPFASSRSTLPAPRELEPNRFWRIANASCICGPNQFIGIREAAVAIGSSAAAGKDPPTIEVHAVASGLRKCTLVLKLRGKMGQTIRAGSCIHLAADVRCS